MKSMPALFFQKAAWAIMTALLLANLAFAQPPTSPLVLRHSLAAVVAADVPTDAGSSFDNLEIVDARLNGKLTISRVGSAVAENNLLSVFASLKNRTAHRLALEIETIYKDNGGNALNDGSWIVLTLKPYEQKDYRSTSISEEAVDFLIRVRRAQPPSVHPQN